MQFFTLMSFAGTNFVDVDEAMSLSQTPCVILRSVDPDRPLVRVVLTSSNRHSSRHGDRRGGPADQQDRQREHERRRWGDTAEMPSNPR